MGRDAKVAGTGFEGRAAVVRKHCSIGKKVILKREPANAHDGNAIAVFLDVPRMGGLLGSPLKQIGYINKTVAKSLARKMDEGQKVSGSVLSFWAPPNADHPRVSVKLEY